MIFGNKAKAVLFIAIFGLSTMGFAQTLTLEQVIKEVCTKSDSVKMMKETMYKSDEMIREQYANAFPKASASVFAGGSYGPGLGGSSGSSSMPDSMLNSAVTYRSLFGSLSQMQKPGQSGFYNASAQITQPLYTFGKVGTAIKVAKQYDKSTHSTFQRNIQQLQLLAVDAYYRVVLSQMALNIAQRSLDRKKELSEFLDRNFRLGSGSKAQLLATQADLKSQIPAIIGAQQSLMAAKMGLNALMGRSLTDPFEPDTAEQLPGLLIRPLPEKKTAAQSAIERRGDLRSLEYFAEANKGGAQIFKAMYYPSIAGTASFGLGGTEPGDLIDLDKRNWTAGFAVQWAFDGFASSAKSRQYTSDARKIMLIREAFSKQIEIEVATNIMECSGSDSNLIAMQDMYAASQESFDLTNDLFKQGSGQFADLQLAEERLRLAELAIVNARYRQLRSRAALLVAMGEDIIKLEDK